MIEIRNLSKSFRTAEGTVEALKQVSLRISDGDIYGIIGMSGAGKSTLVRCINMLERPTEGQVIVDGVDMGALGERELREKRREITMIFQGFNLLMQRSCLDNVCFPLSLSGVRGAEAKQRALELLETVGLRDKAGAYPAQLSGGQQQRVAIARALATRPKILLCDEATSALDPTTTASILELIRSINAQLGITVGIITHQMSVVESVCRNVAILEGGRVVEDGPVSEVFSHPRSAAGKRLVFPEGDAVSALSPREGEHILRVVFNGNEAASAPLIAHMAVETGIEANIGYASTKTVEGREYGTMLLGIRGGEGRAETAIAYLTAHPNIFAEEVLPDA